MKYLKISGLALFVIGFLLFHWVFFLSDYVLTEGTIKKNIPDSQRRSVFLQQAQTVGVLFYSNFSFIHSLHHVIDETNDELLSKYAITEEDLKTILNESEHGYNTRILHEVFNKSNPIDSFRIKAFIDHSEQYIDKKVALEDLQAISFTINHYVIPSEIGFDSYRTKDLVYALTKDCSITPVKERPLLFLLITFGFCVIGASLYILPRIKELPGIKNNGVFFNSMKNTGWLGILTGTWLIIFYIILYFFPEYMTNWIVMVDPISKSLNGHEASRFFLYGLMYTLCILIMGIRMIITYRHSKYQIFRTVSVMFFQLAFAFLIPEILIRLNKPYFDFKNIWPLDYDFFFDSELDKLIDAGTLGVFMVGWGIALIIIAVPVFVYFFGKRWYCSWVCGCGGLAETFGDPYRQLSNKSLKAWKIERWMIHSVLAFAIVMTLAVLYTYWTNNSWFLIVDSYTLRSVYGSFIGAGFAGVVGTGFYPLMGNRVWCRFGCPLAAYLGLIQRFKSKFRITTNGGQCISCGNCSTYCEMGIDVRWYAQRGQNIVRSSCVGCGICSSVCPRGVLNLESRSEEGRYGKPVLLGNNNIELEP